MRSSIAVLSLFALASPAFAVDDVFVDGYKRKDGTEVAPYHRTTPDDTDTNNYGYPGNKNPYTGEIGGRRLSPTYGYDSDRAARGYGYGGR